MEIVGRLATGVAHEVKNPLAIIRLGIDYLSDHLPADDRSALVMADIRDSVGRADNVIKELLDFSRAKPLNRVAVRADSIVENAARLMRHELTRQNIEIVSRYDPSAGLILADSDRMVQVFINLLTNAAQAIGQDGRIEIVVRSLVVSEHELALLDRDFFALGDEAIVVEIADNGPGIPNENLGKLFEPFFTTKPLGAGTGIGLAVSRSIVTTHEAAISLVNRSKGGALATVTFRPYSAPRNWLNSCRRSSIDETAHPDRG